MNHECLQLEIDPRDSTSIAVRHGMTVAEVQNMASDSMPWPISGDHLARAR